MDIQQTLGAANAAPKAADKVRATDKPASAQDDSTQAAAAPAFSRVLQGLRDGASDAAGWQPLTQQTSAETADDVALAALWSADGALALDSLLGQTQRLDQRMELPQGEVALHASNALAAQGALFQGPAGGAQPQWVAGQLVATVAAGVQTAPGAALATAVLSQAADASAALEQAVEGQGDPMPQGRMALEGAWSFEVPTPQEASPVLQRVAGMVEQWAAASAGLSTRGQERTEPGRGTLAAQVEALAAGSGSGVRLMDNAVRETQQAQQAAMDAQPEPPVEDMRFWLQGKLHRAEVTLEKDGQPVRVQVAVRGHEAHVVFSAEQEQTRTLIDGQLQQLREMLAQQGLELAGVQVQSQSSMGGDGAGQQRAPADPWASPVRHAQVQVPQESSTAAAGPRSAGGLDVYA